ncbi:MAG: DedA family protein [Prevotellaceae bacterium]|jgi:membrane-associated protein|nr:DedA family protein [Prevotellaceae bacterium]
MTDIVTFLIDFVLHIDRHLDVIIRDYGALTYLILFLIIFMETGLVVTPFLPGDSLLFAAATFAAIGSLNLIWLILLLVTAAILGDATNYFIGHRLGNRLINTRWVKKEYLDKTHRFYEKHGGKTIIIARFVPIVRTFAPFVAGVGEMSYRRFASFNVIGGVLWVLSFLLAGYFFGNIPIVRQNFGIVIIAIIIISVLPAIIAWFGAHKSGQKN